MIIVDKEQEGFRDVDWVTGSKVGDPHPAIKLNKWIDHDTPLGPIYFVKPTIETMGRMFGMADETVVAEMKDKIAGLEAELADEKAARMVAELDLDHLRHVVEKFYTTTSTTPSPEVAAVKKAAKK